MKKRINIIYSILKEACSAITDEQVDRLNVGFTASELAEKSGYSRSNVSRDLKQLVLEEKVIRIGGRPVLFLVPELPNLLNYSVEKLSKNNFSCLSEFITNLKQSDIKGKTKQTTKKRNSFSDLIGSDKSMKAQVKQAMAAILYPPNGLNTLLIGETGVGKTTFANTMYRFAVTSKTFSDKAPYILFNCADYSGNPQLLLSHLFGHIKGAFTGADQDKEGLVSQADGGILFLDEIHRLPPEGQEMLFSLMDRGEYRRLGESVTLQKANVLIIAATTEDPDEAILKTFLRRIPNVIKIPSLRERSVEERLELIYLYFKSEAKAINRVIRLSTDVANFLLFYECHNNLGQLINDIKLSTASAFSESLAAEKDVVSIELGNLPKHHFDFFEILERQRQHGFDWQGKEWLEFHSKEAPTQIEELVENFKQESAFYKQLEKNSRKYFEKGIDAEEIRKYVDAETMKYFGANDEIAGKQLDRQKPIYKIIPEEEYQFLAELITNVLAEQAIQLNEQAMIGLLIHLKNVINKVRMGHYKNHSHNDLKKSKQLSYQIMAEKIVGKINLFYSVSIPAYETSLIALFLNSLDLRQEEGKVGILVISHGDFSAKDMAAVANRILQVEYAHGLCLPLEENVRQVLKKAVDKVKQIDQGKGVLLLVDMGSLTTFGEIITEETGIPTKTVSCVSTPHVLEATRLAVSNSYQLDEIAQMIKEMTQEYKYQSSAIEQKIQINVQEAKSKEKILKLIEETATFINVSKVSELLEQAYYKILERTSIEHNDSLFIKYIFHTVSMLERAIQKNTLLYYNFKEKINEFESIYTIVLEELREVEVSIGITIDKDEIAYVAEIFYFANFQFEELPVK